MTYAAGIVRGQPAQRRAPFYSPGFCYGPSGYGLGFGAGGPTAGVPTSTGYVVQGTDPITVSHVAIGIAASAVGSSVLLGWYSDLGGLPDQLLYDLGAISSAVTGEAILRCPPATVLFPGPVHFVGLALVGGQTWRVAGSGAGAIGASPRADQDVTMGMANSVAGECWAGQSGQTSLPARFVASGSGVGPRFQFRIAGGRWAV